MSNRPLWTIVQKFHFQDGVGRPFWFWHNLDLKLKEWIQHTWKPIRSRPIHHSKVIGPKVNFQNEFWRSSWIYVDYESCPKLPSWQQSWICSRTLFDYTSPKKFIEKNFPWLRKCKSTIHSKLKLIVNKERDTTCMS